VKLREWLAKLRSPGETRTLALVVVGSFLFTGALLRAWDELDHRLFGVSEEPEQLLQMVAGISTSVVVSVGVALVLMRNRRRYERRMGALQQELIRKERLAAVGELAGGVAHEIRNPLAGIDGALTMLARELPDDDDSRELMEEMQLQVHRMERLVDDLLSYARPGRLHPEWVHVHTLLTQAAQAVRQLPSVPEADLVLDLDPSVGEIFADPRELEHAFENLILNAFQAVRVGGKVEVRTQGGNGLLTVSVADDGCGIEPGQREKIFEPFFTTKARGTGLGLSLVKRAVENNGGDISVQSAAGIGTTFEVSFPLAPGAPAAGEPPRLH
jgi:signal transduction histidine kinase